MQQVRRTRQRKPREGDRVREIKFRAWHKNNKSMCMNVTTDLLGRDYLEFMQYTGLKDKNGKEIYEGDILGGDYYVNNIAGVVKYYDDWGCSFLEYKGGGDEFLWKAARVAEVIGNIYENPELLERI